MKRILIALSVLLCVAIAVPAAAEQGKKKDKQRGGKGPERIALPDGFRPEGITTRKGSARFFVGSIGQGDIYGGSLRTGDGDIVVDAPANRSAIGIKVDKRGRIFVAGGTNVPGNEKGLWVYDSKTRRQVASFELDHDPSFINDVVLTKRAAYFTDSLRPFIYRLAIGKDGSLGPVTEIRLGGDYEQTASFNANGIAAAKGGRVLIIVKSSTGELFTVDPTSGAAKRIAVTGGDGELVNGDGILLKGRRLHVSENQDVDPNKPGRGEVTTVKLRRNLTSGRIVREVSSRDFDVPTTLARWHGRLYAVNARFGTPPTPATEYWVAKVPKR